MPQWMRQRPGHAGSAALQLVLTLSAQAAAPPDEVGALYARASERGSLRLIVQLDFPHQPAGLLTAVEARAQADRIAAMQSALTLRAAAPGTRELRRFRQVPFMVFEADGAGVARIGRLREVAGLREDVPERPALASSAAVIGAPTAWAGGFDGSGQVIAVLDSGVDYAHPWFAAPGKLAAEACFSSSDGNKISSLCPGGATHSTAPGSGGHCPLNVNGCDHGTHVAGIALGDNDTGPDTGIGQGARLISVQVFSRFDNYAGICTGAASPCVASFPSDQAAALEEIYEWREDFAIAAVNLSIGGGGHSNQAQCDAAEPLRKAVIDTLRSAGIATVAASGNGSSRSSISVPACISSAVSVGASTDADTVASFSNVAAFLDLLAPGQSITSAVPGGGTETWNGTSMATPHVAGAWAVLRQADPAAGVDALLELLRVTAVSIDDERTGGTVTDLRRIDLAAALEQLVDPSGTFESSPVPGATLDFGVVRVGQVSEKEVLVTNTGTVDLALGCTLAGPAAAEFGVVNCPAAVTPQTSAAVEIACTPTLPAIHSASLEIHSSDPELPVAEYVLVCTGGAPEFDSLPAPGTPLDFGIVEVGIEGDARSVAVTNAGNVPLLTSCSIAGAGAGGFVLFGCADSVPAGGETNIDLACHPQQQGNLSAVLEIATDDADEPAASFPLLCEGGVAGIETTPAAGALPEFGSVTEATNSEAAEVLVHSVGTVALNLDCNLSGAAPEQFALESCPALLAPGASAPVHVRCSPQFAGSFSATLVLSSNDPDSPQLDFGLSCEGTTELIFADGYEPDE